MAAEVCELPAIVLGYGLGLVGLAMSFVRLSRGKKEIWQRKAKSLVRPEWVFGMEAVKNGRANIVLSAALFGFTMLSFWIAIDATMRCLGLAE